jgi:uncharacterized protein (TIGR02611 family)
VNQIFFETLRQAKRAIIAVVGFTVIALGIVMLVTPGPGWLLIFFGLSVLAVEFVWARAMLKWLQRKGTEIKDAIFGSGKVRNESDPTPPADAPHIAP